MSGIAPARLCAYAVIRRVFEGNAYADRVLHTEARGLDGRDRALATILAYGTVQRKRTLDEILGHLSSRRLETLDPPVLSALRLGLFQLLFLDGISDYAAVHDSVELTKQSGRGGAQLVNAVLRRATREAGALLSTLDDATARRAAVLHSVPDWLAEMWWRELGAQEARALLHTVNQPAETAIRVNTLTASRDEVSAALPTAAQPAPELPEGLVLAGAFDAYGSQLWRDGAIMPQSRASMLVARALAPEPGERVLDLCAAPGGKTTHLAALMDGEGEVVAVEANPGRAQTLAETCARMGADQVQVRHADGRRLTLRPDFDRVLIDPPCSGLGTLQSRPDLRWQPHRGEIEQISQKQMELLAAGAAALRSGGTLVYSVCTISQAEGDGVVTGFLAARPDFVLDSCRQLLPHRDGTDGFFIARLRRRP